MSSKPESSSSSLSSQTDSQGKRKRRKPNKSVSCECNLDKEEKGITSLWYWSNYYKAFMWHKGQEVERWRKYAQSLEYEKMCLLQELNRQKELRKREKRAFKAFSRNQAAWGKPLENEIPEEEEEEDEEAAAAEAEGGEDEEEEEAAAEEAEGEDETAVEAEAEAEGGEEDEGEWEGEEGEGEWEGEEGEGGEWEGDEEENDEDEEIEFELSEEMVKFIEDSIRRKLEKEMEKSKEKEAEEIEEDVKELKEAHELREKEMKQLYGEGSCMIIGMETAVQLSYDKYCDLKSPPYWPNIPLNLRFS